MPLFVKGLKGFVFPTVDSSYPLQLQNHLQFTNVLSYSCHSPYSQTGYVFVINKLQTGAKSPEMVSHCSWSHVCRKTL